MFFLCVIWRCIVWHERLTSANTSARLAETNWKDFATSSRVMRRERNHVNKPIVLLMLIVWRFFFPVSKLVSFPIQESCVRSLQTILLSRIHFASLAAAQRDETDECKVETQSELSAHMRYELSELHLERNAKLKKNLRMLCFVGTQNRKARVKVKGWKNFSHTHVYTKIRMHRNDTFKVYLPLLQSAQRTWECFSFFTER